MSIEVFICASTVQYNNKNTPRGPDTSHCVYNLRVYTSHPTPRCTYDTVDLYGTAAVQEDGTRGDTARGGVWGSFWGRSLRG